VKVLKGSVFPCLFVFSFTCLKFEQPGGGKDPFRLAFFKQK
jgi:hypothetical protein